jgi:hypothetical protein
MKLTSIKWKQLEELQREAGEAYEWHLATMDVLTVTMIQLLHDVRMYKEMMREYDRFFRQHKIKNFSELVKRLAEIENAKT